MMLASLWTQENGEGILLEHVGHAMTYMILTDDTQKLIHQSHV
jgi:hypothetical protein